MSKLRSAIRTLKLLGIEKELLPVVKPIRKREVEGITYIRHVVRPRMKRLEKKLGYRPDINVEYRIPETGIDIPHQTGKIYPPGFVILRKKEREKSMEAAKKYLIKKGK